MLYSVAVPIIYLIICCVVILPIVYYRLKKKATTNYDKANHPVIPETSTINPTQKIYGEDLLSEEEFIKPIYNPWKKFGYFYMLIILKVILIYFLRMTIKSQGGLIITTILEFTLPVIILLCMFYSDRNNFLLKSKTILFAIMLFFAVDVATAFLLNLINFADRVMTVNLFIEGFVTYLIFELIYFLVCSFIIIFLADHKK